MKPSPTLSQRVEAVRRRLEAANRPDPVGSPAQPSSLEPESNRKTIANTGPPVRVVRVNPAAGE